MKMPTDNDFIKAALIVYFLLLLLVPSTMVSAQGSGNCKTNWIHKDEQAPFTYDGNEIITKIVVKSGQGCFVFLRNGNNGCYAVNGIGTTKAKASLVGEESPECQAISHVEFFSGDPMPSPTNTATPTDGVISRNTPTPNTTPFKFWTFTPPPPNTPTVTITIPPDVTLTATPPDTLPPPPKRKTKTPQVLLPETGIDGRRLDDGDMAWFFVLIMILIMLGIAARAMIKSWRS